MIEIKEFKPYLNDLKFYLKRKIKSDWWEDVYQETLCYIYSNKNPIVLSNPKGYLLNTANFFINKHYDYNKKWQTEGVDNIKARVTNNVMFNTSTGFNGFLIDDKLFNKLQTIPSDLYTPLRMQIEEQSIKNIAESLGLNENTVKTRIKRAKEYLKS
jgi:DNA-directed RNA polymerase specialized sigma24 family protein